MKIDTNINILGGLPDFNLIKYFIISEGIGDENHFQFTDIRTLKSVNRFKKAINESFDIENKELKDLFISYLKNEKNENIQYLLFLILSYKNELFRYLNENAFFSVYYSGRTTLHSNEILLCLKDLQKSNKELQAWSPSTLNITASKYLTLLKKLGLADGVTKKEIKYKTLNFEEFLIFNYCFAIFEDKSNKFNSSWIQYSFFEKEFYFQQILDKKLIRYLEINFSGDNFKIKPLINYKDLYYALRSK